MEFVSNTNNHSIKALNQKGSQMRKAILMLACLVAGSANAALVSYTDRISFDAAAGVSTIEDFESYASDTSFQAGILDVGDFTLSMVGSPSPAYNFIDVPPLDTAETDVNGTNHMNVFTEGRSMTNLTFLFDSAITAFGADFRSLNDVIERTQLLVDGEVLSLPIAGASGEFSFFGFTSDTAFTSITFQGVANDVYGIDNVTYSATAVSEPSTIAFLLLGATGLMFARKKRRL